VVELPTEVTTNASVKIVIYKKLRIQNLFVIMSQVLE
jgi:hypothetical protein